MVFPSYPAEKLIFTDGINLYQGSFHDHKYYEKFYKYTWNVYQKITKF